MKAISLFLLLVLSSSHCFGQPEDNGCALDTSETLELTCHIHYLNDTITYLYTVDYSYQCFHCYIEYKIPTMDTFIVQYYSDECDPMYVDFDEKSGIAYLTGPLYGWPDQSRSPIPLDWSKVRSINFDLYYYDSQMSLYNTPHFSDNWLKCNLTVGYEKRKTKIYRSI